MACWLVAIAATGASGETAGPLLYPNGKVKVNGQDSTHSTALFAGDKVQTGQEAFANLNAMGSTISVFPNTSITYGDGSIELGCGQVQIMTVVKRMSARVSNLTILPDSDVANYELIQSANKLQIAAKEGSVVVSDGTQKTTLEAGKLLSFDAAANCPAVEANQAPAPESKAPAKISRAKVGILAGAGAASAVAIPLALRGGGKSPVSASVP